jgi:hypothetical protein
MIIEMLATESTEVHGKKKLPEREILINPSFITPAYAGQKRVAR